MLHALIQKFPLPMDDTFHHAVDRLPPMLDISQQIDRRTNFVLDKIAGFLGSAVLLQQLLVGRADAQARAAVVGKIDDVIVLELFDVNFRRDKDRLFG